jgi:hypothetical protein
MIYSHPTLSFSSFKPRSGACQFLDQHSSSAVILITSFLEKFMAKFNCSFGKEGEIDRPVGFVHDLWTNQMASIGRVHPRFKPKASASDNQPDFVPISTKFCPKWRGHLRNVKEIGKFGRNKNIFITILKIRIFGYYG